MVHAKHAKAIKNRAPMIRSHSCKQLNLTEFDWPFQSALDENNRWVKLSQCIPWDALAQGCYQGLSLMQGCPARDARLVIGAVIIKHKLCLSDRETVAQIQESPCLQYFVGFPVYQMASPFVPALFVEIRKRMGHGVFEVFQGAIIDALEKAKATHRPDPRHQPDKTEKSPQDSDENDPPPASAGLPAQDALAHQGKLILDPTVAPRAILYPTDLSLLNEARQFSEQLIDILYPQTDWMKKPRTCREQARKAFLAMVKQRRPTARAWRCGIKQQLQYLRRNLSHIERLLQHRSQGAVLPLSRWLSYRYQVIQHVYAQQWAMYRDKKHRCDDRIVSISQPYVRLIVRGKLGQAGRVWRQAQCQPER
jgi:hypothetical protein